MVIPPYAASIKWYVAWLRHRLADLDDSRACEAASHDFPDAKAVRRTLIASGNKPEGQLLTVSLCHNSDLLSDHGNWPHVHLGALNAAYGRTPFFTPLFDQLSVLLGSVPESLPDLNRQMHVIITAWIDTEAVAQFIKNHWNLDRHSAVIKHARELATIVNTDFSILDAIFRLGRETTLLLLAGIINERDEIM